jgi:hypothetical protein
VTLQTQATSDCNAVLFVDETSPLAVKEKYTLRTFRETGTEDNVGSKKALTVSWLEDLRES